VRDIPAIAFPGVLLRSPCRERCFGVHDVSRENATCGNLGWRVEFR
jgi:hypothetical protein